LFFKRKFIWMLLLYVLSRNWDILLSYYAFLRDPMLFIIGERNRLIVDFFTSGKTTFLIYEFAGAFLFIGMIYLAKKLWERNFVVSPLIITSFLPFFSFLAPLTWFYPQLVFIFEDLWDKIVIAIALFLPLEFCWWLRKRHRFLFL
jgi:hypothetical protein